jgi:hypothetical protein
MESGEGSLDSSSIVEEFMLLTSCALPHVLRRTLWQSEIKHEQVLESLKAVNDEYERILQAKMEEKRRKAEEAKKVKEERKKLA